MKNHLYEGQVDVLKDFFEEESQKSQGEVLKQLLVERQNKRQQHLTDRQNFIHQISTLQNKKQQLKRRIQNQDGNHKAMMMQRDKILNKLQSEQNILKEDLASKRAVFQKLYKDREVMEEERSKLQVQVDQAQYRKNVAKGRYEGVVKQVEEMERQKRGEVQRLQKYKKQLQYSIVKMERQYQNWYNICDKLDKERKARPEYRSIIDRYEELDKEIKDIIKTDREREGPKIRRIPLEELEKINQKQKGEEKSQITQLQQQVRGLRQNLDDLRLKMELVRMEKDQKEGQLRQKYQYYNLEVQKMKNK